MLCKLCNKVLFIVIVTVFLHCVQTLSVHGVNNGSNSRQRVETNASKLYAKDFKLLLSELLPLYMTKFPMKLRRKRTGGYKSYNSDSEDSLRTTAEKFDGDIFNVLRSTGVLCNLCVVADNEFMNTYGGGELPELRRHLEKLIDSVSWLWRSVDWNGDSFPDNIGFEIMRFNQWDPYPGEELEHYQTPQPAMSILSKLGVIDFGDCCLGVGFTMRPFTQKQAGVSLVGSSTLVGGICDYRTLSPEFRSRNVVLVSGRGVDGYPLISTDLEQVLVHELGHAFGVTKHDNEWIRSGSKKARECSGHSSNNVHDPRYGPDFLASVEPPGGRFIMWRNRDQGKRTLKWNNLQFSSCSKFQVSLMLESKRGICFTEETESFCGNGILESFEECDCGSELNCRLMTCCGSRKSDNPCTKIETYGEPTSSKACTTKHAYPFSIAKSRMQEKAAEERMQDQMVPIQGTESSQKSGIISVHPQIVFICVNSFIFLMQFIFVHP